MKIHIYIFSYALLTSCRVDRYLVFWKQVTFEEISLYAETVMFVVEVIEEAIEGFQKIISILMSWKLFFHQYIRIMSLIS